MVGPQSVLTVWVKGCPTRSVNMDSKDGRATGGAGNCSLALANACVVPAVSWVLGDAGRGIDAGGLGMSAEATRATCALGTDLITGIDATVIAGGRGGADAGSGADATFVVPPSGANATSRAESKSLVSLP